MRIFTHPSFPHIEDVCNHADDECDHEAKGWLPLLSDEQQARFDEIELEVELRGEAGPELLVPLTKNPRR